MATSVESDYVRPEHGMDLCAIVGEDLANAYECATKPHPLYYTEERRATTYIVDSRGAA